ncbi:MAG: hypothetical protein PHE61_01385 [Candidatus Omnitrophica bacterium]|nr:hypothetical protein [Candidatus Omnitrophota bacterium]
MVKDALDRIKRAEEEAASILREAERRSQTTVLDAKLMAKEKLRWAETEAHAEAERIVAKTASAVKSELEKIAGDTRKEKEEIVKRSSGNMPRAIDFITKELLKLYGCSKAE